jgi:hypothetical protein
MSIVPRPKTTIFFSPKAISGCAVWFDGMDINGNGTVPSNGSSVTTWNDKSGNGYNATVASGKVAATYSSAYNALNFATSNTGYQTSYPANPTNETMFVVFNNALPSSANNVIIGGQAGARGLGAGYSGSGGATLNVVGNLNNGIVWLARTSGGSYTSGTTAIVSSQFTSSSNSISLNGGTVSTGGAPGFSNATTTYLGVDTRTTAYYYIGYAMEIIFYNSVLSDSDKQKIEGYLAQKWGLTSSLPAGHPGLTQTIYGTTTSTVFTPIVLIPYNLYTNYNPLTATGSTCILWLDASDPTTLFSDPAGTTLATVNGTVGYWRDKSSSGFNCTQTTLAYRPTYVAAAKNGRSILSFNGLTNFLNMPQFTAVPLTIFFVAQGTVFLTNTFFLSLGNAGSTIMMRMLHIPEYYGVDGPGMLISTTNADTNWHLWSLTISSTTVTFYFDGVLIGNSVMNLGSAYTFATNTIGAWNQQVGSKATTLRIPEILFYSAVLGTSQQKQVESYLTEKWALVSQPTRSFASIVAIPKRVPVEYTQIFTYTGANQTFVVPATTTTISVYMWGAGGAGGYSGVGGAGAFLGGLLPVTPSSSLTIIVGQGGNVNVNSAFGGGGVGSGGGWTGGGGGGGYSGIFNSSTPLVIVGAGGGAAFYNAVGGCGDSVTGTGIRGTTNGAVQSGYGGTQSAGGAGGTGGLANGSAGSYLQGGAGDPAWSAGGGGGYYGGGGGATDNGIGGSGAGGSSYSTLLSNIVASNSPNTGMNAPNTSSTYYASGVAVGGSGYEVVGGNGRVVFVYTA